MLKFKTLTHIKPNSNAHYYCPTSFVDNQGKSGKIKEEERRNVAHQDRSGSRYIVNATTMKQFNTITIW